MIHRLSRPMAVRRAALALACAVVAAGLAPRAADASFGIESFQAVVTTESGAADTQAGSHPYALTTTVKFNTVVGSGGKEEPDQEVKDLHVALPAGLIGDPTAVPRCTRRQFEVTSHPGHSDCPTDSQVGFMVVKLKEIGFYLMSIYNLVPPPGVPAELGGNVFEFGTLLDASVRTGEDYGVSVSSDDTMERGVIEARLVIWGVPGDPRHNSQRCKFEGGAAAHGVETLQSEPKCEPNTFGDETVRPFLTMPGSCGTPLTFTETASSWEGLGLLEGPPFPGAGEAQLVMEGCERLSFTPSVEVSPETQTAGTPTGLTVALKVPQPNAMRIVEGEGKDRETKEPVGVDYSSVAEANLREAVVTLPAGMSVNPSSANGLGACPLLRGRKTKQEEEKRIKTNEQEEKEAKGEISGINLETPQPANCPPESKLATVKIKTPLLEEELEGSVYLAQQGNLPGNGSNPFGSLLAIYLVAEGEAHRLHRREPSDVLVKLPGEIRLDPSTGQLTATFGEDPLTKQDLPQLPFSEMTMEFPGGEDAALVTPSQCGSYQASSSLAPWSGGEPATPPGGPFAITSGCGGGFSPSLSAGTRSNLAGSYSPLTVQLSRNDGEQEMRSVQLQLPPGLLGEVANVQRCGEAQANAGECGPGSEIGTVAVAAGAGERPFWITGGHAYLTGPYAGRPFGLSIVVPAVAGPFNLGSEGRPVVVRAAISVDPQTAAVTISSEPFPAILQGVPLQIKKVVVDADRPGFIVNATSCEPMSVTGTVQSAQGASAALSAPYQAAGCENLPFKPSFSVSTQAKTSKANGASLTVKVAQKPGEANIHKVDLTLPAVLPARLTTLQKACTEAQFGANPAGCPEGSAIGSATVHTPVLSAPLTGPAYLVSHGGAAFPDVEFVLQGEDGVQIVLDGQTQIKGQVTYSRFETVPDAPISSFEAVLPEGPHSALTTAQPGVTNLCAQSIAAPTAIVGQNGAQVTQSTPVAVTGCSAKLAISSHEIRKRTLTLTVYVPAAGRVEVQAPGLTSRRETARGRGTVTFTLRQTHAGRLATTLEITYTPTTGKVRKRQVKTLRLLFSG